MFRLLTPYLASWLILICSVTSVSATHIMGGDLYYQFLDEGIYKITLQYFVDCENGSSAAISSDIDAFFGFFNASTNEVMHTRTITRTGPVKVTQLNYDCVIGDPNACVDKYSYSFDIELGTNDHGIYVVFQRCCRNMTIDNLIDPGSVGMTLVAYIPPSTIVNGSPVFKELPPNFLCNDAPLIFDHSAWDPDGDSLTYELYIPYLGASSSAPKPSTPSKPPYNIVQYKPPYHKMDMMGGKEALKIDEQSGLLTVHPNKIGQYVVGIKVNEFRNGTKISETLRDYQFNVLECEKVVSANMILPQYLCTNRQLTFTSGGSRADTFTWVFKRPGEWDWDTTSTQTDIVLDQPGKYLVKLLVQGSGCADSVTHEINVGELDSLDASFLADPRIICLGDTTFIQRTGTASDHWWWNFGDGSPILKNEDVDFHIYEEEGEFTISLSLDDSLLCHKSDTSYQTVEVYRYRTVEPGLAVHAPDSCYPEKLVLMQTTDSIDGFTWEIEGESSDFKDQQSITRAFEHGDFQIRLVPTDDNLRCTDEIPFDTSITIKTSGISEMRFDLVNVFTPNGDKYNDCFTAGEYNESCVTMKYRIYNRWGECMFDSELDGDCWDSSNRLTGVYCPPGTYYGIYEITDRDQTTTLKSSNTITLIR